MANVTELIEIADFSPGIFADYHVTAGAGFSTANGYIRNQNGAAVIEDTFRCCADGSGALGPLPAAVAQGTYALPSNTTSAYMPTGHRAFYVVDANIMGPIAQDPLGWVRANSDKNLSAETNFIVNAMFSFWYAGDGAGVASGYRHYTLGHSKRFINNAPFSTLDFFFDQATSRHLQSTFPRDIPSAGLVNCRALESGVGPPSFNVDSVNVNLAGIASGRWRHGAAVDISSVTGVAALTTHDTDISTGDFTTSTTDTGFFLFDGGAQFHFPDPATPGTSTIWVNNGTHRPRKPVLISAHQDRVLIVDRDSTEWGAGSSVIRDAFSYGAVNDPKSLYALSRPFRTEYGSENVSGVGVVASISVDRLLVVKNVGGGYIVTGDLNNPTVTKLPFLESTFNIASYPAMTPFGVVYGTPNGVFVWAGGESSERISYQIDGHFWDTRPVTGPKYEGTNGRFGWWHPWVMVPNNFMYDSRTKAWWRLDNVANITPEVGDDTEGIYNAPYHVYLTNPANGNLHAFRRIITEADTTFSHVFDSSILATSYSWKSHPLVETRQRRRSFQQVTVIASGSGTQTVTVTLSGFNEDGTAVTPVSESFPFTGPSTGRPVVLKHNLNTAFVAMDVQVRITSVCSDGKPAAKVHSVSIGTSDRMRTKVDA